MSDLRKFYQLPEFRVLEILWCEETLENNLIDFWLNLKKYLEHRNSTEKRTKIENYDCRYTLQLETDRKLYWHHLFSDSQLQKLSAVVCRTFKEPLDIRENFIIKSPHVREELAKILHEVAQQNGFEYHQVLDDIHMVDDRIRKSCPKTSAIFKKYPHFWLSIPVEKSFEILSMLKAELRPLKYGPIKRPRYFEENMLKILHTEVTFKSDDEKLKKDLETAIYTDVEQQHLNLDHVLGVSTGNPYIVLYNTHP
jgi:hypothetical protein